VVLKKEKITCKDRVKKKVLHRSKEIRNIIDVINRRKANFVTSCVGTAF